MNHDRAAAPPSGSLFEESWCFDIVDASGRACFVRLGWWPARRRAWFWTYVVGPEVGLVAVRDHEIPFPTPLVGVRPRHVVRAEGLWAELVCNEPAEHWSLALEAFGVALDDPADAWAGERGTPVAVGFDLEWERSGDVAALQSPDGVGGSTVQPGVVQGELLIADSTFALTARGVVVHRWGESSWTPRWSAANACTADSAFAFEGGDASTGRAARWQDETVRITEGVPPLGATQDARATVLVPIEQLAGSPVDGWALQRVVGPWRGDLSGDGWSESFVAPIS